MMFLPVLKYRLLQAVYKEPGINVSELLKKSRVPQKSGYACLKDFLKTGVLREELIGQKPTLRKFYPDLEGETGRLVFSIVEIEKSLKFFGEHPEFLGPFEHFKSELAGLGNAVRTAVIFGSYARGGETRESDIDLLVVVSDGNQPGKKKEQLARICEKCFVTVRAHVSARTATESEFLKLKEKNDPVLKTIIADHVCAFGHLGFVELVGKNKSI